MSATHKPATERQTSTKKEFLLFISIPAVIILVVVLVLTLPSAFVHPKYDFIYSYCSSYDCNEDYLVDDSGVAHLEVSPDTNYTVNKPAELYYYDIRHNSSRKIGLAQADAFKLNSTNVSPDGYSLKQSDSSSGGFLFWDDYSDQGWHLQKSSLQKSHALNLTDGGYASPDDLKLIGWVLK